MSLGNYTWAKSVDIVLTIPSAHTQPIQENLPRIIKTSWIRHYGKYTDHITMQCTQQPERDRTQFSDLQKIQCLNWQNTETSEKYCHFGCEAVWTRINSLTFRRYLLHPPYTLTTEAASYFETSLLQYSAPQPGRQYWSWPTPSKRQSYLRSVCKLHECGNYSFNKIEFMVLGNVQFKRNSISKRSFQGHIWNKVHQMVFQYRDKKKFGNPR